MKTFGAGRRMSGPMKRDFERIQCLQRVREKTKLKAIIALVGVPSSEVPSHTSVDE